MKGFCKTANRIKGLLLFRGLFLCEPTIFLQNKLSLKGWITATKLCRYILFLTFADNLPIPFYIPGNISSTQAMDHFNAIKNGIRWFEILFAWGERKGKARG